jgi:hypothetical protein
MVDKRDPIELRRFGSTGFDSSFTISLTQRFPGKMIPLPPSSIALEESET